MLVGVNYNDLFLGNCEQDREEIFHCQNKVMGDKIMICLVKFSIYLN